MQAYSSQNAFSFFFGRYTLLGLSTVFVFIGLCGLSHSESNWREFRGPTGQGFSSATDLPVSWSSSQNITWMKPIPGKGWSSPVIENGRIFMTTSVSQEGDGTSDIGDQSLRVICLDSITGDLEWNVEVFHQDGKTAPRIQGKNSHASPTPIVHQDKLYVHFGHQGTACLTFDGQIIWQTRQIQYPPRHGNGGSPVIFDDLLIFSCDGDEDPFVVALELKTGVQRWRTNRNIEAERPFSFSTPLLIQVKGKPLLISPGSELVGAYNPRTGEEIWRVRYPTGYSVVPRPVYGHGLVFACSGYGTPVLYAIRPDGKGDVTDTHVAWQTNKNVPHNPSLLLIEDELYMVSDDGIGSCLEAKTGEVHWKQRLGGNFSASPLFAGGHVYFQNETSTAFVVKASTMFEQVAVNTFEQISDERTFASYAISAGAIYARTEKHLLRIANR